MKIKNPSLYVLAAMAAVFCLALPSFAQNSKVVTNGPIVIQEFTHDTGPILREVVPLLPEFTLPNQHEIENLDNPRNPWKNKPVRPDPVLQTTNIAGKETPSPNLEFEGLGVNDSFFCNCEPPDNDGAPGPSQYVEDVNIFWAVYDKAGHRTFGPNPGNTFWSGFGGSCQTDDSGDPVVRYDAAAGRWVVAQFAINGVAPDFECVAVSTTSDATGSYNRYAFPFNNFPDYPKIGVWPDAYYFTFNNFNIQGTAFVGANACAFDRTKMIAGQAATAVCFQQNSSQFGELPSDMEGATPPANGTPNFVMELDPSGSATLDLFKFHVDFTTPANSTFTGPTKISVGAFTPLCPTQPRGRCVPQPTPGSDLLESLGNRLMWRLVYRNFGDHTVLLTTHSIVAGTSGGVRWYEIRNPETSPTVFQSGTFAPDSQWRWMPAIDMDQNQDIALGFSRSGTAAGQFPSLVYTGRVPSDPAGTMESEVLLKAGLASQFSAGAQRWGDYSSLAVDPTDDCTFWFAEEYIAVQGGFNWHTAVGNFTFPGCSANPDFSLSANPNALTVVQGNSGTSTITVTPVNGFNGSVTLSASGLPNGVTAGFNPNPTTTTSTLTLTASPTAQTGTSTVTITGTSGSLSHTTTIQLTITGGGGAQISFTPTLLKFGKHLSGTTATKKVTVTNTGGGTLNISNIAVTGTGFALKTFHSKLVTPCVAGIALAPGASCVTKVTFSPTSPGSYNGNLSFTDNAPASPQSVPLTGTGT